MIFGLVHCLLQLALRLSSTIGPVFFAFTVQVIETKDFRWELRKHCNSINADLISFYHTLLGGLGLLNTNYARVTEAFSDASIAVTLMAHQSIGLKVTM